MARTERPEDKIARLMRGTAAANAAPADRGRVTHIRLAGSSTFIGGDVILGGAHDQWAETRAEQSRCRRLIGEIEAELDDLTSSELRQALDWIRTHLIGN